VYAILEKVFHELNVNPKTHLVMLSVPSNFGDAIREQLLSVLITRMSVPGVFMMEQALLVLHSYNSQSGIIVDIGERLDIVPVTDGFITLAGIIRHPIGGAALRESVISSFAERRYRFVSQAEKLLARLAVEKMCYVSTDYISDCRSHDNNSEIFKNQIDLSPYDLPPGTWTHLTNDTGRFKTTEGLFNPQLWGVDFPSLAQLVKQAVQACPMDTRREMWRNIYLSGGTSLLPGLAERLKLELSKLVASSINIEVHTSPNRYHAAFIGACVFAEMPNFEQMCIMADEWKSKGAVSLRKWHNY